MKTVNFKKWPHRAAIGRWSAILLLAVGIQILALARLQAETKKNQIADRDITSAVEHGFTLEKGVLLNDVDVSTSQGIVTLSDSVDNLLAKERAVKIAESIRGVRGVIDVITVRPVPRSEDDIRKDILTALRQDPATEFYQVAVSVQDQVARLTGSVGSYAEKQLAAQIAKGITGIKEVRNDVTINYVSKRTDREIAADVKARLQWDIWINGELINAVAKDGRVTLTGTIGSAISKSRAYDDAWVNGVTSVDDSGIKIEPRGGNAAHREHVYTNRSDSEIKQAVQADLRLDPRVSAFSPDVTVEDGVVRLGGTVGNLKARSSAEWDAESIVGVVRVENFLKVRPKERPTDAEVEKQLKAALLSDSLLDRSTMDVAVRNRVATLSGAVDSNFLKAEAQDVASRTKGVLSVRNHLKVEPESSNHYYDDDRSSYYPYGGYYPYYGWPFNQSSRYEGGMYGASLFLSDEQIKTRIENGFFLSPFVDSDDIKVTVHEGVVTLTGAVGTRIGWGEVDKDAFEGGATKVLNQVVIKHSAWWWWW